MPQRYITIANLLILDELLTTLPLNYSHSSTVTRLIKKTVITAGYISIQGLLSRACVKRFTLTKVKLDASAVKHGQTSLYLCACGYVVSVGRWVMALCAKRKQENLWYIIPMNSAHSAINIKCWTFMDVPYLYIVSLQHGSHLIVPNKQLPTEPINYNYIYAPVVAMETHC